VRSYHGKHWSFVTELVVFVLTTAFRKKIVDNRLPISRTFGVLQSISNTIEKFRLIYV
jgi:hypothetical protein